MPKRIYRAPRVVLNEQDAPHFNGDTAERVMRKRLKQYEEEKRARRRKMTMARRKR